MSVWRYQAVDLRDPSRPTERRGEITGESPAEVRAALRAVGLQVLDLREERSLRPRPAKGERTDGRASAVRSSGSSDGGAAGDGTAIDRWLRNRRVQERADAFDALATLLASGVPLIECVDTLVAAGESMPKHLRRTLVAMRETLRSGESLSVAMTPFRSWFDPAEVAMVEAAQLGGTLPNVLRELAERQERSARLGQRLVSALAYPAIVACVGLGVGVFLSTKTLPQLSSILVSAKLEVPALTSAVMALGQGLAKWWWILSIAIVVTLVGLSVGLPKVVASMPPARRARFDRLLPLAVRRLAVSRAIQRIAELLRSGVPLVESLRVAAPAHRGLTVGLSVALRRTADAIESGADVATALAKAEDGTDTQKRRLESDHTSADRSTDSQRTSGFQTESGAPTECGAWFDAELRRLVAVGEAGGELEQVLVRLGERYERQVSRLVDRLAATLEPAVILALAAIVGTIVMAAVLPLVRLQEIL
jgi:type II secretory pathway component PulF